MEKCATIAVIGRPSAGKSTLINTICEMKVSIVSPLPQTTRNTIRGIYTDQRGQFIFIDTPGYHLSDKTLNIHLKEIAVNTLEESEIILYIVDGTRPPAEEEKALCDILKNVKIPIICFINKLDLIDNSDISEVENFIKTMLPDIKIFKGSAKDDEGIDELLIELFTHAPESPLLYPPEDRTDQNLEFRISEIIREKVINTLSQEIPHAVFVSVSDMEYNKEDKKVWIRAFINVEKESQKGIVVGKGGKNIKDIRVASFKDIKKIFPGCKLEIDLRVRTKNKWKTNSIILNSILKDTKF